jgi:hypothetical protein
MAALDQLHAEAIFNEMVTPSFPVLC